MPFVKIGEYLLNTNEIISIKDVGNNWVVITFRNDKELSIELGCRSFNDIHIMINDL